MKATLLILWLYIITVLHGIRVISKKEAQDHFFSKDYTLILKGLCSIIVIFVHVPITYGNKVQDLVGSFAYICVTLFFLFSAYGLRWSFEKKEQYMQHFIKNRIVVLFIPFVIAFLIKKVCGYDVYSGGTMFIYVLLLFYLLTFLSYKLQIRGGVIVYAGALLYSLGGYCCDIGFGWYVESLGFAYGFLLGDERVKKKLINLLNDYYFMMITSTTTASIILGVSYLKFKQVVFSGDYVLRILLGIALIMWVSSVTYRIKIGNKFSKLLGRISYEIFLLHGFSMSFFSQGSFGLSSGQFIILTFLLTVLLAYILNKIDNTISNMVKEFDFSKA